MTNEEKLQARIAGIESAILDLCHYSKQLGGDSWVWGQIDNTIKRIEQSRVVNKFEKSSEKSNGTM